MDTSRLSGWYNTPTNSPTNDAERIQNRRKSIAAFLLCFAPLLLSLNAYSSVPKEKMFLSVDYAHFRGDSSKVYVELYYSLGVNQLEL